MCKRLLILAQFACSMLLAVSRLPAACAASCCAAADRSGARVVAMLAVAAASLDRPLRTNRLRRTDSCRLCRGLACSRRCLLCFHRPHASSFPLVLPPSRLLVTTTRSLAARCLDANLAVILSCLSGSLRSRQSCPTIRRQARLGKLLRECRRRSCFRFASKSTYVLSLPSDVCRSCRSRSVSCSPSLLFRTTQRLSVRARGSHFSDYASPCS